MKMKTIIAALAVIIAGSFFGATRTDAIREKLVSGDRDYVFVAMHRGDWRNFPENSKGRYFPRSVLARTSWSLTST